MARHPAGRGVHTPGIVAASHLEEQQLAEAMRRSRIEGEEPWVRDPMVAASEASGLVSSAVAGALA
eukprot:5652233-Lingulodinium_polyedra.AAC.1